jgi:hypothetical protein
MSWALPLPKAAQRLVWEFKTQSATAAIMSKPIESLFAEWGHINLPWDDALMYAFWYFMPRFLYRRSLELFGVKSSRCCCGVTRPKLRGSSQRLAATK